MSYTTIRVDLDTKKRLNLLPGRNYDEKINALLREDDTRIRKIVLEEIQKLQRDY